MSDSKARILIVDDHPMVREALAMRVSMEDGLEICGEAAGEEEALELVQQLSPDLAVVDVSLKQGHGIELVKQIRSRFPNTKILVYSTYPESLYAERALRAGALGYLNKQESSEEVAKAIRTVLDGQRYISHEVTEHLLKVALGDSTSEGSLVSTLSDRELEVFQLIGEGVSSSEAAKRLGISVNTIDTYREKIKIKIGVKSAVELQREAVRWVIEQT